MSFKPEKREIATVNFYATNYIILLRDQLPYYKKHNAERYTWLRELLSHLYQRLHSQNYDMTNLSLEADSPSYLEYETLKLDLDQE